ncbi:signal peptidase I [Geodermatophilus sabuli]|uniref:signal peptidase I n=1 Tax=Geodermatophilus sabuli TaxID=1564158 RepID=UPI0015595961|nr:signal peptidase I [Geodermatophilus sabuli]MBB3082995.1 signal peptidase I [Geodermatophilus sabuli]
MPDVGDGAPRSPAATPGAPLSRGGALRRRLGNLAVWAAAGTALLLVASMAGLLPLQLMRVDSGSMIPTIASGDLLVVRHGHGPVQRGDVVAVHHPLEDGLLVKRAVAVGGDQVGLEDGVLVVNGEPVCEPAIDPALMDGVWFGPVTVPEDALFLLSDNRDGSIDSRAFGPVPTDGLVGSVVGRAWPHPGALPSPSAGC